MRVGTPPRRFGRFAGLKIFHVDPSETTNGRTQTFESEQPLRFGLYTKSAPQRAFQPFPMRIQIFTTGGTIDKVYFDAKSEFAVGDPLIASILQQAGVTVPFSVETLMRKDSLDLTDADRALIAERVQTCDCDHILITHGTDTMVDTARALGTVTGKTVVFVGSLTPARFKATDAEFNIGFALGALSALTPGVYVAMSGRIFAPDQVRKNREANQFEMI